MTHYTVCVPVTYTKDGEEKKSFRRVGAAFENSRRDTGEVFLGIKLDFPVGAMELVCFPPTERGDDLVE